MFTEEEFDWALIEAILDNPEVLLNLDREVLFDLYKYTVPGIEKVDGVWVNKENDNE